MLSAFLVHEELDDVPTRLEITHIGAKENHDALWSSAMFEVAQPQQHELSRDYTNANASSIPSPTYASWSVDGAVSLPFSNMLLKSALLFAPAFALFASPSALSPPLAPKPPPLLKPSPPRLPPR